MPAIVRDVNLLPNWAVIHEYFKREKSQEEFEALLDRMPPALGKRLKDMSRVRESKRFHKYPDTWESLATWNIIEQALIKQLGHGFHLREVGRCSRFAAFGSDAFLASMINNPIGRFMTSPVDGYKNVRFDAKRCVTNKEMGFVQTDRGSGYIVMRHNRDIADPFFDFWSVVSFIVGHGDSVNLFWRQDISDLSASTIVAANIFRILKEEAPLSIVEEIDRQLIISGNVHGEIAYMQLGEHGIALDGADALSAEIPGAIPVMRITRDFTTPCSVCEGGHALLREGQIFQYSDTPGHHLPNSAFRVHWDAKWIDYVKPLSSQFVVHKMLTQAETETELTDVRHELEHTREELDALKKVLSRIVPNAYIAEKFADGTLHSFTRDSIVLQFDIIGSTELIKKFEWSGVDQAAHIGKLVSECFRPAVKSGGWDFQEMGDGGIVVFCPRWPTHEHGKVRFKNLSQAARQAVHSAHLMHKAAKSYGMTLRIGVDAGEITWQQKGSFLDDDVLTPRFAANGDPLNLAARLEQSLKENDPPLKSHTRISQVVMDLLHPREVQEMAAKLKNMKLSGGFVYSGMITVKSDEIECWTRAEIPQSILESKEFDGIEDIEVVRLK